MRTARTLLLLILCSVAGFAAEPDEEDPYFLLSGQADKAIDQGDYQAAIDRMREAIAIKPDAAENVLLLSNLGMLYAALDQDSLAMNSYNEALRRAPAMRTVLLNRARLLLKTGKIKNAKSDLDKLIAIDSLDVRGRYLRGMIGLTLADTVTAAADFAVLEALEPASTDTYTAMLSLNTARADLNACLPYARKLIAVDPMPEYYTIAAQALIAKEDYSEAGAVLNEGISKFPENSMLYSQRAALHRLLYRYDEAQKDQAKAQYLARPK